MRAKIEISLFDSFKNTNPIEYYVDIIDCFRKNDYIKLPIKEQISSNENGYCFHPKIHNWLNEMDPKYKFVNYINKYDYFEFDVDELIPILFKLTWL